MTGPRSQKLALVLVLAAFAATVAACGANQGRVLPRRRRRLLRREDLRLHRPWRRRGGKLRLEDHRRSGRRGRDLQLADNPFRDYSFFYLPSCTGDAFLGDLTRKYSPELTVEHKGFVNGITALRYLAEHHPDAAQVVVVGKTVGSVAAPVYGGLVADLLPDAQVTVRRPVGPCSGRPEAEHQDLR
jgi:hypothetical protein